MGKRMISSVAIVFLQHVEFPLISIRVGVLRIRMDLEAGGSHWCDESPTFFHAAPRIEPIHISSHFITFLLNNMLYNMLYIIGFGQSAW